MEIGNRVKELRARNSWSQEKLAQASGVTRQTIAALEKGDYIPSLLLALKICEAFQLKMEEVFWLLKEEEK
ncbi:helix-turn-helix transcriptional regulator [Bacillus infantis]|uniref:helix-turn-helix transcriptional regulator n=1 Tax=Bacillus infantis TaxID=324767 RepID=UPI003B967893